MTDTDLKTAELQEQNALLRKALDYLLDDVENYATPADLTREALEAAGYEYEPVAPSWNYKVSLTYIDTLDSEDEARTPEQAMERIRDRFTSDVTELVLRGSYEEFVAAVEIELTQD